MTSSRRIAVGIDEAGRGSLVGDMFVAGVALVDEQSEHLLASGVRDSKTLSRARRYSLLLDIIRYSETVVVCRITPEEIDRENINDLEVEAVKKILKHVRSRGVNLSRVVIDEIAGRKEVIESFAKELFPEVEIIIKPKADRDFVQVSAASVVAKSLRDGLIRILSRTYGEIGSGYPSDPRTIRWLKEAGSRGSIPICVRKSWKTVRKIPLKTLDMYSKKDRAL